MKIIFYLVPFLVSICIGNVLIAVPLFAISLGASVFALGMLGSILSLSGLSLYFLFGKLSEKWGRKIFLMLGFIIYIVAFLLLSCSFALYQLYLSMALLGMGGAMIWPAIEAWIAESETEEPLNKKVGLFNVSWSGGTAIGLLLGGILFEIKSKLPFYFALATSVFIFLILLWRISVIGSTIKSTTSFHTNSLSEEASIRSSLYTTLSRIAVFTTALSVGTIRYIFPKLGTQLEISPSFLGFLMLILSFSQMLTFYILGIIHRWHYRILPLIFSQLVVLIGLVIVYMTCSFPLFFLAFIFIGIGGGVIISSSLFYSVNVLNQKGPRSAIHESILGSGFFVGPLMGGEIAQKFSLRAPYLVVAVIILAGILIQVLRWFKNPIILQKSGEGENKGLWLQRKDISEECYYLASQWQLMWRKFRKHKLAIGSIFVLP